MASPGQEMFRWTRAEWRAQADRWIDEQLAALGHSIVGYIEQPHVRPWATALTVPTDAGLLWFKASISSLAYEVPLLELIGSVAPDAVPRVFAADPERGWMLIEDSGIEARRFYGGPPPADVWEDFLDAYARLQADVAPSAESLVACGVPDRRRDLVGDFFAFLDSDRSLSIEPDEATRLRELEPRLREAEAVVSALGLPATIHHDDLHAWNICIRADGFRFIDWGDSSVANPLFSLSVPLAHLDDRSEEARARVRDAFLEPWTRYRSRDELIAATPAAMLLANLTGVLKWAVLNTGLPEEERGGYDDVIERRLRGLLEVACA